MKSLLIPILAAGHIESHQVMTTHLLNWHYYRKQMAQMASTWEEY